MRQPDVPAIGPRSPGLDEIDELNRVFSDSFTDRYRRDGMVGVRVPRLSRDIWRYALLGSGEGAKVWDDEEGQIVAFNLAHCSGLEGWMGPLAVRSDRQGSGLGHAIVENAVSWLQKMRVRTIGLETMPRTVDNIGFYASLGFLPGHLTVTMVGGGTRNGGKKHPLLSQVEGSDFDDLVEACMQRLKTAAPGVDFTKEIQLTRELGLGDTVVIEDRGIRGFALWHSSALIEGRPAEEFRLLKLFADSPSTLHHLLGTIEELAAAGPGRVAVRCQTSYDEAFSALVARGYRVRWTDLRMTLTGFPAVRSSPPEIVFSNWEI